MYIYNTLTKKKEEFKPINGNKVSMYVCGPTVYDYFHIGNARSFIMADILRRYLEYKGFEVTYAMNLTDVDDKIIKKSIEEKCPPNEVSERYIDAFFEDISKLNVKKATYYPKATEHMGEIIKMIKELEEKGIAYNVDGNVFYNVKKFDGYGKLSGKNIDQLEAGSRIEINKEKNNPLDFSLWKKAKKGEPAWDSPWGKGRPGWHIECSAMSMKHLGETIDIHAGGNDLVFPHHENEIAQSEACCTKKFVNYWIHFGFLNLKNEKMSKSLGNFFTARDIVKKYDAEVIRYFMCQSQYGSPLNFSDDLLKSASSGLKKIQSFVEDVVQKMGDSDGSGGESFEFEKFYRKFEEEMDDNFNFPKGIAVIFDFMKSFNIFIADNEKVNKDDLENALEFIQKTAGDVLGIIDVEKIKEKTAGASSEKELMDLLIELRLDAKKEKNFGLADKIRDRLKEIGFELKDGKSGTTYKKQI